MPAVNYPQMPAPAWSNNGLKQQIQPVTAGLTYDEKINDLKI
jgi:hypothetical protein